MKQMKLNHESLENRSLLAGCAEYYFVAETVTVDFTCDLSAPIAPTLATSTLAFTLDPAGQSISLKHILKTPVTAACAGSEPLSYDCYVSDKYSMSAVGTLSVVGTSPASTTTCAFDFTETVTMPTGSALSTTPLMNSGFNFPVPYHNSTTATGSVLFAVADPSGNLPAGAFAPNTLPSLRVAGPLNVKFIACTDGTHQLVEVAGTGLALAGINNGGTAVNLGTTGALFDFAATGLSVVQGGLGVNKAVNYESNVNTNHFDTTQAAAFEKAQVDCYFNYDPAKCVIIA